MDKKYNVLIVGATGLVGQELLSLLETTSIPIASLTCCASFRSKGKTVKFHEETLPIVELDPKLFMHCDIAFFCAGGTVSQEFIPIARKHTLCIDLSSAFRLDPDVPLVIPEINKEALLHHQGVIASPNCTATLLLMAIYPLYKEFGVRRIVTSTYQAASGGGITLIRKLLNDTESALQGHKQSSESYGFNLFLHNSPLSEEKFSAEEIKLKEESKKILSDPSLSISATCVRVPVLRAHSLSVNVECAKDLHLESVYTAMRNMPGLQIQEDLDAALFPTPFMASFQKETFVGRIRLDPTRKNCVDMWVVGDQLLKGAAYNGLQIAEQVIALL
ncbi:MAG: aspartate-semialdehyde dehydrogenase [Parachlamydiales bacterium]|nr:aspartate-semialdehyde dehydrogenase [Parachlamydiales bacterium]